VEIAAMREVSYVADFDIEVSQGTVFVEPVVFKSPVAWSFMSGVEAIRIFA
jgi:hypothetical protein